MKKAILFFTILSFLSAAKAQTFVPKDSIIGNNFFQVEFSEDSRSMVWCEQIPLTLKAKVWYADMDLNTGLPNLTAKQLIDTIQGQGWPYWGRDNVSLFFLIKNQFGQIKYIRRTGVNTLTTTNLGTVNGDVKSLLNVSSDSRKPYFWVNYTVLNADNTGRDSLFIFRSDNPSNRLFIDSEFKNMGGSAYELTFPRWLAQSEILAYPFRPLSTQPVWDMKFWNGQTRTSTQVTNDIPTSIFNHHVDDFPFTLPQFPNDTFMFSSRAASRLAIYKKTGQFFTQTQIYTSPTSILPTMLTSFEPFTINTNKTYGAYQVYSGGGIPGTTAGEIYLKGIFNDTMHLKISTINGVAVDPEYVIGNKKVWIYYYGKLVGTGFFDLHRCETPLTIGTTATENLHENKVVVYPNPFTNQINVENAKDDEDFMLINALGQTVYFGRNISNKDFSHLRNGIYFLTIIDFEKKTPPQYFKLFKQ